MTVLSLEELKYTDTYYKNIEEFKDEFFSKLKEDKVDVSKFTEDKLAYMTYGYKMDGVVLYYETSSKETVKTIFKNKLKGITAMTLQSKQTYSKNFYNNLMKKALEKAKSKATRMVKVANRKLGEIVKLSGGEPAYSNWNDVSYYKYDEFYSVYVVYELL